MHMCIAISHFMCLSIELTYKILGFESHRPIVDKFIGWACHIHEQETNDPCMHACING